MKIPDDSRKLIQTKVKNGSQMIAVARAIFSADFEDYEYESSMFSIFHLICDDSEDIILTGFGRFDSLPIDVECSGVSKVNYDKEIDEIYAEYRDDFHLSIDQFVKKFKL